jgi:hypothetical protein
MVVQKPLPPASPEAVETQEWQQVEHASDPDRVRDFLAKHPNGTHAEPARSLLDNIFWTHTSKTDLQSLRAYLREFASGAHATEANSQIDLLVWKAVDQSDVEQVRKFVQENPNNRYAKDARGIVDRFNARQELLGKQVLDTLNNLNLAFDKKQESKVKALWPNASEMFLKQLRLAGQKISIQPLESAKIRGDAATIRCGLNTMLPRPASQNAYLKLRYAGDQWIIDDLKVVQ